MAPLVVRMAAVGVGLQCMALVAGVSVPNRTENELRDRRTAFLKAINTHSEAAVEGYISPDVVAVTSGPTLTGEEAREFLVGIAAIPGEPNLSGKIDTLQVDGDTAVLVATDTWTFADESGRTLSLPDRSRETWQKIGGQWLLIRNEYPIRTQPFSCPAD